ncbi:MAG: primosomal protein N' [Deltaproteobacteria bacterium RIFCSPLOWO2_02_FULL_47_10]|nr:MAG: primosomal protein N' [Deltaproteobacteria bacterium RIFCSPLOWO2_02_FULL_47_10]
MFVQVAIAVPLRKTFVYRVPAGMCVVKGARVAVPFNRRLMVGYAMETTDHKPKSIGQEFEIKDIVETMDEQPVFAPKMLSLVKWVSDYYCAPIGEVCRATLPNRLARKTKKKIGIEPKEAVIDGVFNAPLVTLTQLQRKAYENIRVHVQGSNFNVTLLHGVTGSGKTEIYLQLIEDVLKYGRNAIFLVPEIGMAPQTVGRVQSRFGNLVSIYHSGLGDAKRLYEWNRMKSGDAKIVVGTRSAVFAPFLNLGLIVADEEHDPSYKQEESPRYNGRDVAVMRAKLEGVPCILGSATPSIESFANTKTKKYHYISLPERPTGTLLPSVEIVDMRETGKGAYISPMLIAEIAETLRSKEQTMLFLNRRGFANFVLCRACGDTPICPNCSITLSYHKFEGELMCHYCDYKIPRSEICKKCGSRDILPYGTGTEKIEEELKLIFPSARILRFDRDTASKAGARPKILSEMKMGGADILIGTQMITKGHDFPNVTLVGVIDADLSLGFPDFRAPERTFQLITQVAGRAGRRDKQGRVVIQSFNPEHYAILAAKDHDIFKFYNEELPKRKELNYSPFGRLALIRVQGVKESTVKEFAHKLASHMQERVTPARQVTLLGPAPAPLSKIRNKHRWQVLIKSNNINELRDAIENAVNFGESPGVKVIVDVDPVNML